MTTPEKTKSKAPANADTWTHWLTQLDALQAESAELSGLSAAREALARAENHARYVIRLANQATLPGRFYHDPDEQDRPRLAELMRQVSNMATKAREARSFTAQPREYQSAANELYRRAAEARDALAEAEENAAELEQARAELEERREAIEAEAPKATPAALATLRKEWEATTAERDRIRRTVDGMAHDDSALTLAAESEKAARERLEEAEALLAMGESGKGEVTNARAAAEKARTAHAEQQAEHARQDAARRGLSRKLEEVENRAEGLGRAYRQALGRVREAELSALEQSLVSDLEHLLAERLEAMAAIYADLEEAHPGAVYGPAAATVTLPHLHHHERQDELNGASLEIRKESAE